MYIRLINYDGTKEITFDNKAYVLNEKDFGNAPITFSTFKGNNRIGMKITNRTLEQREISITGYILADNEAEMLNRKRELQRVVNPFEDFFIVVGDYKLQVAANASIMYGVPHYENNSQLTKFMLNGTAANPCFSSTYEFAAPVGYWKPGFHFPLVMTKETPIRMGVRQPSMIKMIENKGEVEVGLKIKFIANAPITNPFIMNMLTGEKLTIKCDMAANDYIEVNTNYGEKSIVKNGEEDYFYKLDLDSDFIQLHLGENYLRFGADKAENQLITEITYSPQYLEV